MLTEYQQTHLLEYFWKANTKQVQMNSAPICSKLQANTSIRRWGETYSSYLADYNGNFSPVKPGQLSKRQKNWAAGYTKVTIVKDRERIRF